MSEGKKMLAGAAGILLVIAMIFIGVMVYNKGESTVSESTTKFDSFVSQFGDAELVLFENGSASGSDVLNLISGLDSSSGYTVTVTNGKTKTRSYASSGGVSSTGSTVSLSELITEAKARNNEYYINPNATFTSSIRKDDNGVVVEVIFKQVN